MIDNIQRMAYSGEFVLIAEIGVNYYDIAEERGITPMAAAKLMIDEAKAVGIHAVKFQSYKADTLAAKESPYYWDLTEEPTTSQYELFRKFDSFGENEYKELSEYSEKTGIEFLSTPFDIASADYLEELMNVYKISSSDLNNHQFIEYQAKKGKPVLLSTGASNADEIDAALQLIRKHNDKPIILMHCVLEYPTPYEHANLNKIVSLKERYPDIIIGYSDHTKPDETYDIIKTAYCLGASVIEKHFTLNKSLKGNDHYHAMDPNDARNILKSVNRIKLMRGSGRLECLDTERKARENARRSLVSNVDIKKDSIIIREMLTWKRPGTGIPADKYDDVVGMVANENIPQDTVLKWNMIRSN